jgi:predicted nucleic acid-binding protein
MTLALDTTGLLARYVDGPHRAVALLACNTDRDWCESALALTETLVVLHRSITDATQQRLVERAVREDWERITVVPVDDRCLDRAATLGSEHYVASADAIHLAAADRLPRPVTFLTFDPRQIPVAMALGFEIASV